MMTFYSIRNKAWFQPRENNLILSIHFSQKEQRNTLICVQHIWKPLLIFHFRRKHVFLSPLSSLISDHGELRFKAFTDSATVNMGLPAGVKYRSEEENGQEINCTDRDTEKERGKERLMEDKKKK